MRCVYRNPDEKGKTQTHVEYDAKTKTLTGFMTWGNGSDWNGYYWATKAWESPQMKKAFPQTIKWIESH